MLLRMNNTKIQGKILDNSDNSEIYLVVDDSSTMRRIIANTLIRLGIKNVLQAQDGKEALVIYRKNKDSIKAILTDWNMPVMNGLEFINMVRKEDKDTPIIMITTEGGKREVITALKAGANQYIVKPFSQDVLREKLSYLAN